MEAQGVIHKVTEPTDWVSMISLCTIVQGKKSPLLIACHSHQQRTKIMHIPLDIQIHLVQFSTESLTELKRKTQQDATLSTLIQIITHGWPGRIKDLATSLQPYWSFRDEPTVDDSIIMRGPGVIVPKSMHKYTLAKLHEGHQGITKTKLRAKDCVLA